MYKFVSLSINNNFIYLLSYTEGILWSVVFFFYYNNFIEIIHICKLHPLICTTRWFCSIILFTLKKIYIYIWLHHILAAASGIFTESCDIFMLSCGIFQCDTPLSNSGPPAPERAGSVVAGYRLSCLPANGILVLKPGIEPTSPTLWGSLLAQLVKNLPAMWETWVWSLGWEDPLD